LAPEFPLRFATPVIAGICFNDPLVADKEGMFKKYAFGANPSAKMRCGASATINASKTAIKPARTNIGVFLMFSTIPE
jgi:hypothetical protein